MLASARHGEASSFMRAIIRQRHACSSMYTGMPRSNISSATLPANAPESELLQELLSRLLRLDSFRLLCLPLLSRLPIVFKACVFKA